MNPARLQHPRKVAEWWRLAPPALPTLLGITLLLLMTLAGTRPALAQSDAYSVEVAVAGRTPAERQDAYQVALRSVLLANSGDKTLMNRDDVREALTVAEQYVETYRFRAPEPGTLIAADTPVTTAVRETGEATGLLLVRFDRDGILALVSGDAPAALLDPQDAADADAVDPLARVSQALVWLLIDEGNQVVRGTDNAAAKVRERLRELGGGGGVSLLFPTDEGSADAVSDEALRSLDIDAIRAASLRYAADVVFIGHVARAGQTSLELDADRPDNGTDTGIVAGAAGVQGTLPEGEGGWTGSWVKFAGEQSQSVQTGGATLDDVLRGGVSWLAGDPTLGQPANYEYGGVGSSTEALVRIDGVTSLNDYTRLNRMLTTVPGVAASWAREISGDTMVFAVLPRSSLGAVSSAMDALPWLRRSGFSPDTDLSEMARNAELIYDVLP